MHRRPHTTLLDAKRLRSPSLRAMPAPTKACIICGEKASLRCSRCRRGPFCSAPCQKNDWPAHRRICVNESRKPAVAAKAVRKPSPMADVAAALGPIEASIRGNVATPEAVERSDRCVLTLTPMVFGSCGDREAGGVKDDYDRLLASPRSLRNESDAFAKAVGKFAFLDILKDPAQAFSTLSGRQGECCNVIDCRELGDDLFFTLGPAGPPLDTTRRAEVKRAVQRGAVRLEYVTADSARACGQGDAWDLAFRGCSCDPALVRIKVDCADPAAMFEPE